MNNEFPRSTSLPPNSDRGPLQEFTSLGVVDYGTHYTIKADGRPVQHVSDLAQVMEYVRSVYSLRDQYGVSLHYAPGAFRRRVPISAHILRRVAQCPLHGAHTSSSSDCSSGSSLESIPEEKTLRRSAASQGENRLSAPAGIFLPKKKTGRMRKTK